MGRSEARRTMSVVQRSRSLMLLFWLGTTVASYGCASGGFARVEAFPDGEQTNILIGGLMSGIKDANVVERMYLAPYEKVWAAVKRVAEQFDKVGKRPLAAIDEKNGRIQNGRLTQDTLLGLGGGAWADEFVMEATAVSPDRTKVMVSRKVVEKQFVTRAGAAKGVEGNWKSQWSNGQIENWLLTRIEDEISKKP